VDVRVLAATNRDLQQEVAAGRFRPDLFYRLSVFPIVLPPLRERPEDIAPLAAHFVEHAARRFGRLAPRVTARAIRTLEAYSWPGNVRELQHVIERGVLLSPARVLRLDGVLAELDNTTRLGPAQPSREVALAVIPEPEWRRRERQNLRAALELAGGRIYGSNGAAELLKIKPWDFETPKSAPAARHIAARHIDARPSHLGRQPTQHPEARRGCGHLSSLSRARFS
jgi:transcriptional regulator with GAF, ATPase, and Fis domain